MIFTIRILYCINESLAPSCTKASGYPRDGGYSMIPQYKGCAGKKNLDGWGRRKPPSIVFFRPPGTFGKR